MSNYFQLNLDRFKQDEFKVEPAERIIIREHRQVLQNSLGSRDRNDAVLAAYLFTFLALGILLIISFLNYKLFQKKEKFNAPRSKK